MTKTKTLKVFSSTTVAGMVAAAIISSQAFASVNAYSVKIGDKIYRYEKEQLEKDFLNYKSNEKSVLYDEFTKKLAEAKGFYAFDDSKNGYVDYSSIEHKFLEARESGKPFNVDEFTESKDSKKVDLKKTDAKVIKKAIINKDGNIDYIDEIINDEEGANLSIQSVKALNLKQVKVEFNRAVTDQDKIDDIEDEENYTLYDSDNNEVKIKNEQGKDTVVEKVQLDKDKKGATITFRDAFDDKGDYVIASDKEKDKGIVNQEEYKLQFDSNITGEEVTKTVIFKDYTNPKVESIKVVGDDSIEVNFTEPVRPTHLETDRKVACLDDTDMEINNGNISIDRIQLSNNNKTATVKVADTLEDGEKLKIKVQGSIHDYAGYGVEAMTENNLIVKKDNADPKVVSYKDVKAGKATLVFDKEIKFERTDDKLMTFGDLSIDDVFGSDGDIKNWNDIKDVVKQKASGIKDPDYYHTNPANPAYAVKIDGKELTLYFDEDNNEINKQTCYINVNAGKLESLWDVENRKICKEVQRRKDSRKLEVKSIEQATNDADKIKIKFNKKVDRSTAEKTGNYVLKDADGIKVSIKEAEKTDSKEVTLTTSKDLESIKYKLTIEDVEDEDGNKIEKVTKSFNGTDKSPVESDDLTVNLYNEGKADQKIVIDFDNNMKTSGEYSIKDAGKYTLRASEPVFNGNKEIQISKLYNSSVNTIEGNKKVEIKLPYKKDKDDSYKIKENENKKFDIYDKNEKLVAKNVELKIVVGRVSDVDGNVNPSELVQDINNEDGYVHVKQEDGLDLVRAISTDEIQVTFEDKLDFKSKDVKLVAADTPQEAIQNAEKKNGVIKVAGWGNKAVDGRTVITMRLDKNQEGSLDSKYDDNSKNKHVLSYDGKFDGKKVYFVTKEDVSQIDSKNAYDAKMAPKMCIEVIDNIAPALVDNSKHDKSYKYVGNGDFANLEEKDIKNDDQAVETKLPEFKNGKYTSNEGSIVLTFEESINKDSLSPNSFRLDGDKKYKKLQIKEVTLDENHENQVVVKFDGLQQLDENEQIEQGFRINQNAPIADRSPINRGHGNQVFDIRTQVGNFDSIKSVEPTTNATSAEKIDSNKSLNNVIKDIEVGEVPGSTFKPMTTIKVTLKDGEDYSKYIVTFKDKPLNFRESQKTGNKAFILTVDGKYTKEDIEKLIKIKLK